MSAYSSRNPKSDPHRQRHAKIHAKLVAKPVEPPLRTYLVLSRTNYGLMPHVVNAPTTEEARRLAEADGAWDGADVIEIDTSKPGVVATAEPTGG